jgi:hypothetical protein
MRSEWSLKAASEHLNRVNYYVAWSRSEMSIDLEDDDIYIYACLSV